MKRAKFILIAAAMWLCSACIEDNFVLPAVPEPEPEPPIVVDSSLTVNRILGEWEIVDGKIEYKDSIKNTPIKTDITKILHSKFIFLKGIYERPDINALYPEKVYEYVASEDNLIGTASSMVTGVPAYERWQVTEVNDTQMKLRLMDYYICVYTNCKRIANFKVLELELKRIKQTTATQ